MEKILFLVCTLNLIIVSCKKDKEDVKSDDVPEELKVEQLSDKQVDIGIT